MTAREKEIYRYGYMVAQAKIAADIEAACDHERFTAPCKNCRHAARIARGDA